MSAIDRLAAIEAARAKARLDHPDLTAWLDYHKEHFPEGSAHFYPKGRPFVEPGGITMDRMENAAHWQAMIRRERQKEIISRKMKEKFVK